MTKHPLVNALSAIAYIAMVATLMFYGQKVIGPGEGLIMPVTMLSVFVLSAATMGMIFFYHPVQMYLDGDKNGSLSLLTKSIAFFAAITATLIVVMFFVSWA